MFGGVGTCSPGSCVAGRLDWQSYSNRIGAEGKEEWQPGCSRFSVSGGDLGSLRRSRVREPRMGLFCDPVLGRSLWGWVPVVFARSSLDHRLLSGTPPCSRDAFVTSGKRPGGDGRDTRERFARCPRFRKALDSRPLESASCCCCQKVSLPPEVWDWWRAWRCLRSRGHELRRRDDGDPFPRCARERSQTRALRRSARYSFSGRNESGLVRAFFR